MSPKPKNLEMPHILNISDELTLLVGFNEKSKKVIIAIGKGGFEDFDTKDQISLPVEAARRTPGFLQDFLMSWNTSLASEHIRDILRMEEATSKIGVEPTPSNQGASPSGRTTKFEDHCEICGKKVTTETSTGWFKLYKEGSIVWICPDHDTRETFLFSEKNRE